MTTPFNENAASLDMSSRVIPSTAVVASPAAAAETIIASVTMPGNLQYAKGVQLRGWAAFTVGTNGTAVQLKLHQTNAAGATVADSGATTAVAANLGALGIDGFDTAPAAGQVYKLTMTVANGSAPSTVSAVSLLAIAV